MPIELSSCDHGIILYYCTAPVCNITFDKVNIVHFTFIEVACQFRLISFHVSSCSGLLYLFHDSQNSNDSNPIDNN